MGFFKKYCIYGGGGFGKETMQILIDDLHRNNYQNIEIQDIACFMLDQDYYVKQKIMGCDVIPKSKFDPSKYQVVCAIGDPHDRKKAVESLPPNTTFATIIHQDAIISPFCTIGIGSIITAGVIITVDVVIGMHSQINLHSTIGHDTVISEYLTTAPAVNISGKCNIGKQVYFGTNSCIKEKLNVADNVTIGMGAVVVKDITESGVYVGNPLRKLANKSF